MPIKNKAHKTSRKGTEQFMDVDQAGGVYFTPDVSCEKIGGQAQIKGGSECPNRGPADPSFYKELYGGGAGWWNTMTKRRKTPKRKTTKRTQKKKHGAKRRV